MDTYRKLNRTELDHVAEQIEDAGNATALDVEEAFGEHDIEYWVPKRNRLVPATDEEIAQIQEWERERVAMRHLARLKEAERPNRRWNARLSGHLRALRLWRSRSAHNAAQARSVAPMTSHDESWL